MKRFLYIILGLFALLLPWHGALTVFLPEGVRYWKEGLLALVAVVWILVELVRIFEGTSKKISWLEFVALEIIVFGGIILLLGDSWSTYKLVALRYLLQGVGAFFLFSRLFQATGMGYAQIFQKFSTIFIFSTLGSVLYGLWAKFGGGFEILSQFYSDTISSWVPGQAVPIYHQIGDFIRVQGGSSGPIEFAHLVFGAFFLLRTMSWRAWEKLILVIVFLFAVYQSGSRAVMGVAGLLLLWDSFTWLRMKGVKKGVLWLGGIGILLVGGGVSLHYQMPQKVLGRMGTAEHFTRPVEALQLGMKRPFLGNLGDLGPAKRAENLETVNNDQALIAENVFVDVFAQLGILGALLYLLFWFLLWWRSGVEGRLFVGAFFLLANMATIFDMIPLALFVWICFAFLSQVGQYRPRT